MQLGPLDHVNVRTSRVEAMRAWYVRVLGMVDGDRPPFPFPGAWLYTGANPVVHLVAVDAEPANEDPKLEHFAFSARGLQTFKQRLDELGEAYEVRVVPGLGLVQVNVWDPDGNHIHIDFQPSEPGAADAPAWGQRDSMVTRKG
jgi:catechol 2,3-dioxygenase-like lactoylglutathione lyase family enzyme